MKELESQLETMTLVQQDSIEVIESKASIKDVCALVDSKANSNDVYKLLDEMKRTIQLLSS